MTSTPSPLEQLSDEALALDWQKHKNPVVLDFLYTRYEKRLFRYFFSRTEQLNDTEDLLSEISIKLLTKLNTFKSTQPFSHWLFKIAANLVHDYWRQKKKGASFQDPKSLSSLCVLSEPKDFFILEKLKQCLKKLSEREYQIFFLKHAEELTYREIGISFCFSPQMAEKAEKNIREKLNRCIQRPEQKNP